jgi:tRNA G18 (ribose-2'-O)-methylase SpoU
MSNSPLLAWYRGVRDPDLLAAGGRFVAEGRAVVGRLLADARFAVESVLVSPAAAAALQPVLESRPDVPVFVLPVRELVALAGYNVHRGCLAIASRPDPLDASTLVAVHGGTTRVLGLEALADADNVGACFRNAAAFGAGAVLLDEACADPFYRKAIRTSMAATLQVPFARIAAWPGAIAELRRAGFLSVALTPGAGAVELFEVVPAVAHAARVLLVVGNEGRGLADATLAACDHRARIAMAAGMDSVNVATAAGIALHALWQNAEGRKLKAEG